VPTLSKAARGGALTAHVCLNSNRIFFGSPLKLEILLQILALIHIYSLLLGRKI
jgi:hypothetical protein